MKAVLAVLLVGCAAAPPAGGARPAVSEQGVHEALERATVLARRCLTPGDRVTVEGAFAGPTGALLVERTGAASGATSERVRQCVAMMLERAQVPPFAGDRHVVRWTVAGAEISPDVLALLGDGGVVTAPSPVPADAVVAADWARVTAVVRGEAAEFRACYELALRGTPALRGRVVVRFALAVDGRITEARAEGAPGFRAVGHCILGRLRQLTFPAPTGATVEFEYPFDFAPSPPPAGDPSALGS